MAARKFLGDIIARYLGIGGATADSTNVLSVRGSGSLYDGDSGGHQIRVNKNAAGNTASFLFQTGFSGRAEFGLIGNDDFELKVSDDGSAFTQAFVVDGGTGVTDFKLEPTYLGQQFWHTGDFDIADYAALTGATFTGGITATTFAGNGASLTDVDAAYLGGQAPSSYALLSGAAFSGSVSAADFAGDGSALTDLNASELSTGTVPEARLPDVARLANNVTNTIGNYTIFTNDGGGNIGMRWNATPPGSALVENGIAYELEVTNDSSTGDFMINVGKGATNTAGDAITWTTAFRINDDFSVDILAGALDMNNQPILNATQIGIGGATPDATNTFAFYGTDLLLNSGGSINMKYNKNAAGNDASMTFQSGFMTYGLMGLLGNNDFTLKVGTGFTTALVANNSDGTVSFPEGVRHDTVTAYKTSTQTLTGTGTWDDIASWDGTHIAASGNLSWTASSGQAFMGKAGRFMVSYSVSTEISSGAARSDSLAKLQKWNGSAWVDVEGTTHRMYNRTATRGGSCAAWQGVLDLTGSEGLKLVVTVETGTDTIIVDQASLSITRL